MRRETQPTTPGRLLGACLLALAMGVLAVSAPAQGAPPAGAVADDPPVVEAVPEATDVEYSAPSGPVLLGAPVELVVRGADLVELQVDAGAYLGDVLVGRPERSADDASVTVRRTLRFARDGLYRMPLLVVRGDGRVEALPTLDLQVQLDLPVGKKPRVSGLLGPVELPRPPAPVWPFLGGCLAGLALLGWLVWAAGRDKPVVVYVPPPDEVALGALARLRGDLPRTREEIRPFVIRVSDVLRTYVEGVFRLHAPAQTTEEFLAELAHRHDALGRRRAALAEFLERCDLVKYAGERPAPAAAEPLLDTVQSFVDETRGLVDHGALGGPSGPTDAPTDASTDAPAGGADGDPDGAADEDAPLAAGSDSTVRTAEVPS